MSVIYCKERTSWPLFYFLKLRLYDVEDDAYTVFVVVSYHTLVRIGCVSDDNSILFGCKFCWIVLLFEFLDLLPLELHILTSLIKSHFHASVVNDLSISIN